MSDLEATTVDLSPPISMRWPPALLARAEALATTAGPGITRSIILRMACERGMGDVEAFVAQVRGLVSGNSAPADQA
jgi:hypothetical protein